MLCLQYSSAVRQRCCSKIAGAEAAVSVLCRLIDYELRDGERYALQNSSAVRQRCAPSHLLVSLLTASGL
jgi:hypothetical protein